METIGKIDKFISEKQMGVAQGPRKKKDDKPLPKSKLKWAILRHMDMQKWFEDLKAEIEKGDKNAIRASLSTIKSLIDTVERGLNL